MRGALAALVIVLLCPRAGASYIYEFQSTSWEYLGSGVAPFSAGKQLSYRVLVDFTGASYIDYYDQPDFYDYTPANNIRFYTAYIDGDSLGGTFPYIAGYHRGWSSTASYTDGPFANLTVDNWTIIFSNSTRGLTPLRIDQWQVGTQTYFINRFFDPSTGTTSDLQGYLLITHIEELPLPAAAWLLGSAIGVLGCVRSRSSRRLQSRIPDNNVV